MMLVVLAVTAGAAPVGAEVLAVPDAVRQWQGPKDEHHVLRSPAGAALGTQHAHVVVEGQRLRFDIVTRFTSGDEWEEKGELDLSDGFRARSFAKTMRTAGRVVQEQRVDFTSGAIRWLVDGVQSERTMGLPPDLYIGPMVGIVLGGPAARAAASASFRALVFRPDPMVVTMRAKAAEAPAPTGGPATRFRLKADLGPVKNVLFASLIPTHDFWFSHGRAPELLGFEGKLGNGLEVVMTPQAPATTTARVR
jgi:hypothetical protein